jgi:NADPH:quinone reductase
VQLAARAGAHVIACVGSAERGAGLLDLGASDVVVSLEKVEPVYGVLENVGGELLARAYTLLEPNGCLQSIGMASLQPTLLDFEAARLRGGGRIEAFNVFTHGGAFGHDLDILLETAADSREVAARKTARQLPAAFQINHVGGRSRANHARLPVVCRRHKKCCFMQPVILF